MVLQGKDAVFATWVINYIYALYHFANKEELNIAYVCMFKNLSRNY